MSSGIRGPDRPIVAAANNRTGDYYNSTHRNLPGIVRLSREFKCYAHELAITIHDYPCFRSSFDTGFEICIQVSPRWRINGLFDSANNKTKTR
jgi:hypothetical protein